MVKSPLLILTDLPAMIASGILSIVANISSSPTALSTLPSITPVGGTMPPYNQGYADHEVDVKHFHTIKYFSLIQRILVGIFVQISRNLPKASRDRKGVPKGCKAQRSDDSSEYPFLKRST